MCLAHAKHYFGHSSAFFLLLSNVGVIWVGRGWNAQRKQPNQSWQRRNDANGRRHRQQRHGRKHKHNHKHKSRTHRMEKTGELPELHVACAPNDEDQWPPPIIRPLHRAHVKCVAFPDCSGWRNWIVYICIYISIYIQCWMECIGKHIIGTWSLWTPRCPIPFPLCANPSSAYVQLKINQATNLTNTKLEFGIVWKPWNSGKRVLFSYVCTFAFNSPPPTRNSSVPSMKEGSAWCYQIIKLKNCQPLNLTNH